MIARIALLMSRFWRLRATRHANLTEKAERNFRWWSARAWRRK